MMLDFSKFKPFKVSDILQIYNGKGITKEEIEENIGDFNAVQSGEENNGVIGKINKEYCYQKGYTLTEEPCLTVARSGSSGYVSFQPCGCVVGDSAKILIIKGTHKTINIYLFIQTLLRANRFKYAYGRKVTEDNYMKDIIYLPVSLDGQPDWQYMDDYIKSLSIEVSQTKNVSNSHNINININEWKYFKIGNLFKLEAGKVSSTDVLLEGNDIFYCGAKKDENGVITKYAYDKKYVSKGNCIVFICDGQGAVGYNNYMDRDFIATVNLVMGYNDNLNKYNGLFLVSLLDLERPKFSFGRKRKKTLANTEIKLPAKLNSKNEYEPDWQYMEDYIKSLPYGDVI